MSKAFAVRKPREGTLQEKRCVLDQLYWVEVCSMVFTMIVAEPWNFESSDGENILKVRYVKQEKNYFIFESVSDYEGRVRYLMFKNRSSHYSGVYSIAKIGDDIETIDEESLQLDFLASMREAEAGRFMKWLYENPPEGFFAMA